MSIVRRQPEGRPSSSTLRPVVARRAALRRGLTLTELLVTIGLMAFLSSIALLGLWEAQEVARESRAEAQVARIDALLKERLDDYASRGVQLNIPWPGNGPGGSFGRRDYGQLRVCAIRERIRVELPDRKLDVYFSGSPAQTPTLGSQPVSLTVAYRNMLGPTGAWTAQYQGAECLYAILATTYSGEENGLDFFKASEIGDKDNDGRLEIHDAWGNPIEFIRWAPGLDSPLHTRKETQTIAIVGVPTGGNFRLRFSGTTAWTGNLSHLATADQVKTALLGLSPPAALDTTDPNPVKGPDGGPYTVKFLADANPSLLVGDASGLLGGTLPDGTPPDGVAAIRVTTDFIDPLDPYEAFQDGPGSGPPLHPYIVSAGRDGKYGIFGLCDPDGDPTMLPVADYNTAGPYDNPYLKFADPAASSALRFLGESYMYDTAATADANRGPSTDNITNHLTEAG